MSKGRETLRRLFAHTGANYEQAKPPSRRARRTEPLVNHAGVSDTARPALSRGGGVPWVVAELFCDGMTCTKCPCARRFAMFGEV
jgi:hypothetical protein